MNRELSKTSQLEFTLSLSKGSKNIKKAMNLDDLEIKIEERLRELRRQRDMSQEELAEALGVSRQSIIALEQGRYLPSLPIAISLCRVFDMAFEELFSLQREMDEVLEQNKHIEVRVVNSALPAQGKENEMNTEMEPWRPIGGAMSLRDAVDRLMSDSFITPRSVGFTMPKIDIKERKEDIVVKAELPGVAEEDVDIEVSSDGVVTISGERKAEKEEKEEGYFYKESMSGKFSRSFSLPTEVVADKAEADMENGILTVIIPKARPEKVQKLKVQAKKK